jgi:hypothetical protein
MPAMNLRPARAEDAAVIAEIWLHGWRDAHVGNVPEALVEVRTPESFRTRGADRLGDTVVAVVGDAVAGFVMVVGDEGPFDNPAVYAGGTIPVPCRRYIKTV